MLNTIQSHIGNLEYPNILETNASTEIEFAVDFICILTRSVLVRVEDFKCIFVTCFFIKPNSAPMSIFRMPSCHPSTFTFLTLSCHASLLLSIHFHIRPLCCYPYTFMPSLFDIEIYIYTILPSITWYIFSV